MTETEKKAFLEALDRAVMAYQADQEEGLSHEEERDSLLPVLDAAIDVLNAFEVCQPEA